MSSFLSAELVLRLLTLALSHFHSVECALFLVPWAYLVGMSIACSFLLYNLLYHLTAPSKTVASVGVNRNRGRATSSGISDEHSANPAVATGIGKIEEGEEEEAVPEHQPIKFTNSFARPPKGGE